MLSLNVSKYKFSIILTTNSIIFYISIQFHFIFRHISVVRAFLIKIPTQSCTLVDGSELRNYL